MQPQPQPQTARVVTRRIVETAIEEVTEFPLIHVRAAVPRETVTTYNAKGPYYPDDVLEWLQAGKHVRHTEDVERIALYERHEAHPGGEVTVVGDAVFQAALTPRVAAALDAGQLIAVNPDGSPARQ